MNEFVFTLKDTTKKAFNTFFWFLYCVHLLIAALMIGNTENPLQKKTAIVSFAFWIIATILYYFFKHKFRLFRFQLAMFAAMLAFWLIQYAWLPAIFCAVIIVFVLRVFAIKSTAAFSTSGILIIKSLFKKQYHWKEVDNVVLKDGLLSIDLKNNHLIQAEIDPEDTTNAAEFNNFCKAQLG
ncbi:hypothetical protein [Ferruginibacter sp.]